MNRFRKAAAIKPLAFFLSLVMAQTGFPMFAFLPDPGPMAPPPPKRKAVVSRPLTANELSGYRGRDGRNSYIAGSAKYSVSYKGIDLLSGNYSTSYTDLSFEGGSGIPVNVTRTYSSNDPNEGPLGKGWTLSVDLRQTAGGLMKGNSAPVRSVPVEFRERKSTEADPNATYGTEPVSAVVSVDAAGQKETLARAADGVIEGPPWDKNTQDSVYEFRSGQRMLVHNVTTTPEGTVYVYDKEGEFTSGEDSNVLKVTSVTDRHGNETDYYYGSGTVTFAKEQGSSTEHPLIGILMPGRATTTDSASHSVTVAFAWTSGRITGATDGTRSVSYSYTSGNLTGFTSAGGKSTSYTYGTAQTDAGGSGNTTGLLTGVTDCRGMTTTIEYMACDFKLRPVNNIVRAAFCYRIYWGNGTSTAVKIKDPAYGTSFPSDYPTWPSVIKGETDFVDFPYHFGSVLTDYADAYNVGTIYTAVYSESGEDYVWVEVGGYGAGVMNATHAGEVKEYAASTLDLVYQETVVSGMPCVSGRKFWSQTDPSGDQVPYYTEDKTSSYNFMGQPLSVTVRQANDVPPCNWGSTVTTDYAYWGPDKYWQRKAVRTQVVASPSTGHPEYDGHASGTKHWNYSFTDYYTKDEHTSGAARGMAKSVYSPEFLVYGEDSGAQVPSGAGDDAWKYKVVPASGSYPSVKFQYDGQGRCTQVDKLKVASGSGTFVSTVTNYGGSYGMASDVTEAYGTSDARTTYTNEYHVSGKATKTTDAAGHEFQTDYDGDMVVQDVKRIDGSYASSPKTIVQYSYGSSNSTNGCLLSVTDGLTLITETLDYYTSTSDGAAYGQVKSVNEAPGLSAGSYKVWYEYWPSGDRKFAVYKTPTGASGANEYVAWGYTDYIPAGSCTGGSRVFRTMTKFAASANGTGYTIGDASSEEFHYEYDNAGKLRAAAFAQTPTATSVLSNGTWYDDGHSAQRRVRGYFLYGLGQRMEEASYYVDELYSGSYTSSAVMGQGRATSGQSSLYDPVTGLKAPSSSTRVHTYLANSSGTFAEAYNEYYGYNVENGYLVAATFSNNSTNGGNGSWSYDPRGNRANSGYSYDNLNRMTASPGSQTYENDAMGNRTWRDHNVNTDQGVKYKWDELNRMTSLQGHSDGATYTYRADGMRTKKVTGIMIAYNVDDQGVVSGYYDVYATNRPTWRYFYDGQAPIAEDHTYNPGSGTVVDVTRYGLGARGIDYIEQTLATYSASPTTLKSYPLYDTHGNMFGQVCRAADTPPDSSFVSLYNPLGNDFKLGDKREYDAWGAVRWSEGTPAHQGYCGNLQHRLDSESGLVYMRARYYEPAAGRFLSEDPARSSLNYYAYCDNDPINSSDPTGKTKIRHDWVDWFKLAMVLVGAGIVIAGLEVERGEWAGGLAIACCSCLIASVALGSMTDMEPLGQILLASGDLIMAIGGIVAGYSRASKTAAGLAVLGLMTECMFVVGALLDIEATDSEGVPV